MKKILIFLAIFLLTFPAMAQVAFRSLSGGALNTSTQSFVAVPASGADILVSLGTCAASNTGTSGATVPFLNGANTWSGTQTLSAVNLATDTATGMDIGTATNQKIGFFAATPIVQPSGNALTALSNLGLVATPTLTATNVGLGSVTNNAQTQAAIVPNTAPSAGQILVGNAGGTAYAPVTLSGSGATATMSSAGVLTLSGVANASLSNSSMTIGGQSISLGGTTTNQGNGGKIQLSTGTTTLNDCVKFDTNGNTVDAGAACGSGGSGDTITSPNSTLTVGGTTSNTTLDVNLSNANTWAALQTFGTNISIGGVTATGATGTGNVVFSASPSITGAETITGTSATTLAVGANGATNPVLAVDASTASVATGIGIKGAATGGTTAITATDSGAASNIDLEAKGAGTITIGGTSTGNNTIGGNSAGVVTLNGSSVTMKAAGTTFFTTSGTTGGKNLAFTAAAGSAVHYQFTNPSDTALTLSTEFPDLKFVAATRQWATGTLALQRDYLFPGNTNSFVGASSLTNSATIGFSLPGCGTNATCPTVSGIYHASTALTATGTITSSFPLNIAADTGATNNYAAQIAGTISLLPSATLPVVSTCGSGTLTTGSGDHKGSISGISAATACTITFGTALSAAPSCTFSDSAGTAVGISAISTTAVTTSMTALTGTLYYICF